MIIAVLEGTLGSNIYYTQRTRERERDVTHRETKELEATLHGTQKRWEEIEQEGGI